MRQLEPPPRRLGPSVVDDVKTLGDHLASDAAFRRRFERGAVHVAALKHPNIVTVYDVGNEGDTYYIVMELIEGSSFQAELQETAPYMGIERVEELAAQLLAGLGPTGAPARYEGTDPRPAKGRLL